MKKNYIFLLLFSGFTIMSQGQFNLSNTRKISNSKLELMKGNPIQWYFTKIRSSNNSTGTATIIHRNSIGRNTSFIGVDLPRRQEIVSLTGSPQFSINNSGYCEQQSASMDYLNEDAFSLVNTNQTFSSLVFPGSFIETASLLTGRPVFYRGATNRSPLTIEISITNPTAGVNAVSISNFDVNNMSNLNTELRDRNFGAAIPPTFVFKTMEVSNIEQFTASLDYSAGIMLPLEELGVPLDLSQGLQVNGDQNTTEKMRTYLLSFIQPMYAYTVKQVNPDLFFSVSNQARSHPNAGYVNSVVFGRMIMLLVQSTESLSSVEAAVNLRLGLKVTSGQLADAQLGVNVTAKSKSDFNQVVKKFTACVYGGEGRSALAVIQNPDEVYNYIQSSSARTLGARTGALPIQYIFQRVSDGKPIGVRSTSSFNIQDCLNPRYDIDVIYKGIKGNKVVEAPFDTEEDVFGTCSVSGVQLFSIAEDRAISVKAGETKDADIIKRIKNSQTINDIKNLRLTFSTNIKDWELLIKPQFREQQQADLVFNLENKVNQLFNLNAGEAVIIDKKTQNLKLYENGNDDNASVSILYQIKITRK